MLTYYYTSLASANNLLIQYDSYPYPEDVLVFVCSIGQWWCIATIRKGSIFNCPGNENLITLRHSAFENATGTCNDGNIVAYNIDVDVANNSSQLNIIVNPEMHNGTIECVRDKYNLTILLLQWGPIL